MQLSDDPFHFVRQEVANKIYQGQNEEQVLRWLKLQAGIEGRFAQSLIAEGWDAKRIAVRRRAKWLLLGSVLGLSVPVVYGAFQFYTGFFELKSTAIALAVGGSSLVAMVHSIRELITGHVEGSVE